MNLQTKKIKKLFIFWGCLAALLLSFVPLQAQETRGSIRGTITDPNGAAVPGAVVKITDPARGTTLSLTTNQEGFYQALYLVPGTYQIVVESGGFKRSVRDSVLLQISQALQADFALEVGGTQETVTVTSALPDLNTENASLGQVIDSQRIANLPLIHGDPYKLIGLAPGVTHTGSQRLDRPFEPTHIVGYAIDGTRGNRSDLTIDGAPSTSTANANEVIASYVPPTDIVQEFKVQTATFDAQFGNTEGGVTSISIKSGTNAVNGSLYYFAEPKNWGANDFFGNARGQDRPDSKSDRFGGYISGPVYIPWLYKGTDKTFFLFGYEGIRDARPRFDAGTAETSPWVPTAELAAGNFSGYNVTIWDPLTRVAGTGTGPGQNGCAVSAFCATSSFAGNIIPANRISPVARAVLEYWAKPKNPGLTGNIFDSTLQETTDPYDNYTFRIDQNITSKNRLFVRGSYYDRISAYNDYTGTAYSGVNFLFKARQGVIDDVHTFNSTTFLNVRYGYNRFIRGQDQEPDAQGFDLTQLGFSSAYNSLVSEQIRRFPRFDFTGGPLGNGMSNEFRPTTTHSGAAILNKIINTHALKFGGELRIYREDNNFQSNDQTGQFVFNNTYTRQASNGSTADPNGLQGYAAFLLGLPTTMQIVRRSDYSEYSKTYGFFVHDDWKVTSKLSLNLGLRYEVETALVERNDKSVSGFDFDYTHPFQQTVRDRLIANPVTGVDPNSFTTTGGLLFAGKDGGSGLYNTPKNVFLPRFGVAYKLDDKTVLRAGFGLFAGFLGQRRGDVIQPGYTQTTVFPLDQLATGAPIPFSISNFPSINIQEPIGNARGLQTGLGGGISFFTQNPEVSKQARYQVGIQRELPLGFVVEAVYVGNYGYDIEIARNINALPNQYLSTDNFRSPEMLAINTFLGANVPNPFRNIPGFEGTASGTNPNITRSQLLRPFPQFGDITSSVNDGKSWYHSAQLTLNKRFEKGFTYQLSYTWSKWLQATEYLNAGDELPTKMISDQDAPHRLSMSAIYELPFGKGKQFLSDNGAVDRFVGGWQIQGVYQFQVGFPIRLGTNAFYNGGDLSLPADQRTTGRWFNTDAFTSVFNSTATLATPVAHLRTLPFYFSDLRRDSINNFDFSVIKNTRINERMQIQLRFEFVNIFNEAYFPAPLVNPTATNFGQIAPSNQDNYARRGQFGIKFLF